MAMAQPATCLMRILHISVSDTLGGAATAAWRIHDAIRRSGANSRMLVGRKGRGDASVIERYHGIVGKARMRLQPIVEDRVAQLQHSPNTIIHSLGLLPTGTPAHMAAAGADIINLHWINQATISVGEIARLGKPIVWTLHDTWPFSGCEHYDDMAHPGRFSRAYTPMSRAPGHTGLDLDAWNFRRKLRLWRNANITIVTPSRWLGEQSRASSLFGGRDHHVISYPINLDVYRAIPKDSARAVLGVDPSHMVLSFLGSSEDPRKGFDLLAAALHTLSAQDRSRLTLLFGGGGAPQGLPADIAVHAVGRIDDDLTVNAFHAAADLFCAPSRQDNLPLTVMEALSSGTPVLAFDIGGMPDMIVGGTCGALVPAFDTRLLAAAISRHMADPAASVRASQAARARAEAIFSPKLIAERYDTLYRSILAR
jgi:glycosyltransferase involved in cell wall biosynthesis